MFNFNEIKNALMETTPLYDDVVNIIMDMVKPKQFKVNKEEYFKITHKIYDDENNIICQYDNGGEKNTRSPDRFYIVDRGDDYIIIREISRSYTKWGKLGKPLKRKIKVCKSSNIEYFTYKYNKLSANGIISSKGIE